MSRLLQSPSSPPPHPRRAFDLVDVGGHPRLRDANGRVYRLRPEPGDPATAIGEDGDMIYDDTTLYIRAAGQWVVLNPPAEE
jgi:hypothetical protein